MHIPRTTQPWHRAEIVVPRVACPANPCETPASQGVNPGTPQLAPSETLYHLRRCYPNPMACREGRKALYNLRHRSMIIPLKHRYHPAARRLRATPATMPVRTPVEPPHPADMDSVL